MYTTDTLTDPSASDWYMDSGATSHLAGNPGTLQPDLKHNIKHSVIAGDGSSLPVTSVGSTSITTNSRPLSLSNVLVAPKIIKKLIYVRKFTTDNWCSVEFDPFGFSVKDLQTRKTIIRCESSGYLYPLPASLNSSAPKSTALLASTPSLWHKRLGHTNNAVLKSVFSSNSNLCNKEITVTLVFWENI